MTKFHLAVTLSGFALALSVSVMPVLAHHSVAAEFDMSKKITIQGTVTGVEKMNPHARLWVETKNGDAATANWELELPPPNALKRMLENEDFVRRGDPVGVTLWRAKDGALLGTALPMVFPDGRVMNLPHGWL